VRTLCAECRVVAAPSPGEAKMLAELGLSATQPVATAPGCDACNHTGYRGRTGVYELLLVDDAIRRAIHDGAGELTLRDAAVRAGMRSLRADGARWIADGTSSLSELLRVTRDA
jgi:general secretion pathway protein E